MAVISTGTCRQSPHHHANPFPTSAPCPDVFIPSPPFPIIPPRDHVAPPTSNLNHHPSPVPSRPRSYPRCRPRAPFSSHPARPRPPPPYNASSPLTSSPHHPPRGRHHRHGRHDIHPRPPPGRPPRRPLPVPQRLAASQRRPRKQRPHPPGVMASVLDVRVPLSPKTTPPDHGVHVAAKSKAGKASSPSTAKPTRGWANQNSRW